MTNPSPPPTRQKQDFTKVVGTYTAHFDQVQLDDDDEPAAAAVSEDQRQKRRGKAAQVTDS